MKLGMQRGLIDRAALFFMKRVVRSIVTKRTKTDKNGQIRTETDKNGQRVCELPYLCNAKEKLNSNKIK